MAGDTEGQVKCGLKYWSKVHGHLASDKSKQPNVFLDETAKSHLISNVAGPSCAPCSGHHWTDSDSCLHCEELLQLTVVSILLLRAKSDRTCAEQAGTLVTEYDLCQKLVVRLFASSSYISHVASRALVSVITLDPLQFFTKGNLQELVLNILENCHSSHHVSTAFLLLKKVLKSAGLCEEAKRQYIATLDSLWNKFITKYTENVHHSGCCLAFLALWRTMFKECGLISDTALENYNIASTFLQYLDHLCTKLKTDWINNRMLYKAFLQLFSAVLCYWKDLAVQKTIPRLYETTSMYILSSGVFDDASIAPVLNSCSLAGFGGSNNQHGHEHCDACMDGSCVTTPSDRPSIPLLRKLVLLQVNTHTVALKSRYLEQSCTEEGGNIEFLEKTILDLHQMCVSVEKKLRFENPTNLSTAGFDWLPEVFGEQDNSWIEVLLAATDLYVIGKTWFEQRSQPNKMSATINPHRLFLQLLQSTAYDHSVLLDLLTSPETCFLLYLLKYLKLLSQEWDTFRDLHKEMKLANESMKTSLESLSHLTQDDGESLKTESAPGGRYQQQPTLTEETGKNLSEVNLKESQLLLHQQHTSTSGPKDESEIVPEPLNSESVVDEDIGSGGMVITTNEHLQKQSLQQCEEVKSNQITSLGLSWIQFYSDSSNEEELVSDNNSNESIEEMSKESSPVSTDKVSAHGTCKEVSDIDFLKSSILDTPDCTAASGICSGVDSYPPLHTDSIPTNPSTTGDILNVTVDNKESQRGNFTLGSTDFISLPIHRDSKLEDLTDIKAAVEGSMTRPNDVSCHTFPEVSTSTSPALDRTVGCLIRLQLALERLNNSSMFPYNPEKLIHVLQNCVDLYEA